MGQVVLAEENLLFVYSQFFLYEAFDPELVHKPRDHGLPEDLPGPREGLKARHQDPFELDKWLLIENNIIQILKPDAREPAAKMNSMLRKAKIMLLPCEPLLFGGCNKLPILEQRSRRIMIIAANT